MNRKGFYQNVIGDMYDNVHVIGRRDGLDEAWHLINAQGGYDSPGDLAGNAYNKAMLDALNIIEKLGGMDPQQRGNSE